MSVDDALQAGVDPVVYVVRHPDGFALYPFDENVATMMRTGKLDINQTLAAISYLDVSLMVSECGGDVKWRHGADVTYSDLSSMAFIRLS